MRRSIFVSVAALLGLSLVVSSVQAAPFLDINFDSDTDGSPPTVTYPTTTNPATNLWAIGGYGPESMPPVAANGTVVVGDAAGISNGVIMTTNPANSTLGALWLDNAVAAIGQRLTMSFDINVLAAPTSATTQTKLLNGGGSAGILLGMNTFVSGGNPGARFAVAPTSETGGIFSFRSPDNSTLHGFFNYVEGQTYNVMMDVDYNTGTLDAFVDGNLVMSDFAFTSGPMLNATTNEFFFHLNGESFASSVAIDNISASLVPEPAGIALAGVALIGLFAAVRRKRNATAKSNAVA